MKYPLFIVLLVAILITAGCVSENKNTPVTPTPQVVYVTVTVLVTPTPLPVATETPLVAATATPMAVITSPYFYRDDVTGIFYRQPPGYVCTDFRPQWEVGPDRIYYLRCEKKV